MLGDNKREKMSILFSDIRSFTTLSEGMTPDENFAFINAYLERMGPVIRDHNGFIDKYIGDAIMALFANADDAVRAGARHARARSSGFNADRRSGRPRTPIAFGVGINTGPLMLGTIGEQHRMDGTVISDAVNLAARVESLTKTYRIGLLISQHTYDGLADPKAYDIRPIDVVVVKGKSKPVTLFEVFRRNDPAERAAKGQTRDLLLSGVEAAGASRYSDRPPVLSAGPGALSGRSRCDEPAEKLRLRLVRAYCAVAWAPGRGARWQPRRRLSP